MRMHHRAFVLALLSSVSVSSAYSSVVTGKPCVLTTTVWKEFLPSVIHSKGSIAPKEGAEGGSWVFDLSPVADQNFEISCPNKDSRLGNFNSRAVTAYCDPNGFIRTEYGRVSPEDLRCSLQIGESIRNDGTYGSDNIQRILITCDGYDWIEICHDETVSSTLWTKHKLDGTRLSSCDHITRPSWKEAGYYPEISANTCYTVAGQTDTIQQILGYNNYINYTSNYYLSRGHLTPMADGCTTMCQEATFYYINAQPQWQNINGGNWLNIEYFIRDYALDNQRTLTIWTGGYKTMTLKDEYNQSREIWLGKNTDGTLCDLLPVPAITWKVVMDNVKQTGCAIITINNPYESCHESWYYSFCAAPQPSPFPGWDDSVMKNVERGWSCIMSIEYFMNVTGWTYSYTIPVLPMMSYS